MQYQRFDPTGCNFPRPKVPVLPAVSRQTLGHAKASNFKPLGSDADAVSFTRGRYALTEAYRLAGVDKNSSLLAPAYHCRTMLDPAIRLGGTIALYPLKPDLSPDLAALAVCHAACQKPVKAMLLTHYFGFAQALKPIADFCAQHGITLIEDCSHALFVNANKAATADSTHLAMGKTGRFGVASPYKFFASEDGGLLWANEPNEQPLTPQKAQPLKQLLKGIVHALQRSRAQTMDCHPALAMTNRDAVLANTEQQTTPAAGMGSRDFPTCGEDILEQSTATSHSYQPEQEHLQSLVISRWVMRHTDIERLARLRRKNYLTWAAAVSSLPHCSALFPKLTPDCVPYMFPLFTAHSEKHFFALKQLGLPIWRWDDMAVSGCPVATSYRLKLLHLPCHQELTDEQMAWMTSTLAKVMTQSLAGSS